MFRKKNLVSSLLNVMGMTVAFAALYIIMVQVHHDFSYNRNLKDHERIYVLTMPDWYTDGNYMYWLNRPMSEHIISSVSAIEAGGTCYLSGTQGDIFLSSSGDISDRDSFDRQMSMSMSSFTDGALEVFGVEFVRGSFADVLPGNYIAVSESEAERLGLDIDSFCAIRYGGSSKIFYQVKAIYKDMPKNTDFDSFAIFSNNNENGMDDWSEWSYPYFVKLAEGASVEEVEAACYESLVNYLKENNYPVDEEEMEARFMPHLIPIADAYFDKNFSSPGQNGNKTTTVTLLLVAVLVILIAFINYINFFFAMVPVRIRSVNTRKVLGSSRGSIIRSFIAESLLMIIVSLVLAAVVVVLFGGSSIAGLISCNIAFGANVGVAALTVLLAVFISVVASIYPALYITSFPPALVIRGSFGAGAKGRTLRYSLIGLQFVISIALIVSSMFINLQRNFMMKHDMGFNRENLLVVTTSWAVANNSSDAVTNSLKASPLVKDVTWANGDIVAEERMGWGRTFKGENINFQCYLVSWNFLEVMGIDIVEGRSFLRSDEFSENGTFIFNEAARDKYGITLEDKMQGHMDEPADIAGFCENFNFQSLQSEVAPFALYIFGAHPWRRNNTLFVRTNDGADLREAMDVMKNAIAAVDAETPLDEINVEIFDEQLAKSYYKEENLSKLITLFTLLAVIISLMGVFGLVMFETEYRCKEIGVRRVNGATVAEILAMFNMKFVRIVLVCFALAAPVSWLIMDNYLSRFAYRTPLYVWVFLVALLAVLAVTLAVVTLRSYRASTLNPVNVLRNE